jgi:hypothetical protein
MENFGIKELYDIKFKAIYPLEFCGRTYEEDEVILRLDRALYSVLNTSKTRITANGGYGNRVLIHWDDIQPMRIQLQQGVISKLNLALLTNNFLVKNKSVEVAISDTIQASIGDTTESFLSQEINLEKPYFLYDNNFNKIDKGEYKIKGNKITINNLSPETKYFILDYYTNKDSVDILRIGQNSLNGFLKLEAKTRVKDDIDGQEKTGIFIIPKLRVMSDLSMRLGDTIEPYMYTFTFEAEPVGARHEEYVCDLVFLEEDLDADI